ncbi:uncharacterized protein PHACADRAFT_202008 [Phanerochaete carnosa HHB-10118-sp]|uniref:BTB domain-containing protein n=1 Tax=Phanerochaete carnosa (strain HHB-10118-sp) TaxID=650164 RepID=K5WFX6_PHACS|nr:uncharacterized protein PHACADRAFT_202008 [Phanerochaete carnosa HHB-10118-sp]EKM49107.1 hypothetical protein PHACADRAFT_202008 [Phanerochaete carnosa HHB-10118-sp]
MDLAAGMEENVPASASAPTQSIERYADDGDLVLQVDSTIYKVHRSLFCMHSEVFAGIFTLPSQLEGSSNEHPMKLEIVTFPENQPVSSQDIDYLLDWLYNKCPTYLVKMLLAVL